MNAIARTELDSTTPVVAAFVSQKGGVGKSTLARGLATFATASKLKTKIADLDLQQRTLVLWELTRSREGVQPALDVEAFADVKQALASAKTCDLLVVDTPGQVTDETTTIAQSAHLVVQPTSPSADDLHLAVLVFRALERVGIAREKLAFALCGILAPSEERCTFLPLALWERTCWIPGGARGLPPSHGTWAIDNRNSAPHPRCSRQSIAR